MNILYVGHRYHTNQIPIMKGWKEIGVKTMFLAQYEGIGEVHTDVCVFRRMKLSPFLWLHFLIIDFICNPVDAEKKKLKHFIPSFIATYFQIRSFSPDVVIIREFKVGNAIVSLVCRILRVKSVIMYVQDPLFGKDAGKHIFRDLFRKVFFPAVTFTPVVRNGEDRKYSQLRSSYDSPKYFIPLVYDASSTIRSSYFEDGIIRILDIGKYRDYKNHFFFVDAISKISDKSKIKVTIVGQLSNSDENEYYSLLQSHIDKLGLSEIIQLRENVSYDEMNNLYQQHDVFILASKHETAGMVILEAMANGLCVLSSCNCGLASYLDQYECGYVFSINNLCHLSNLITMLSENKMLIIEKGQKAQKVTLEQMSFNNYFNNLCTIINNEFNYKITK